MPGYWFSSSAITSRTVSPGTDNLACPLVRSRSSGGIQTVAITRAQPCACCFQIASSTLDGDIGSTSMRTPIAS